MVFKRSGASTRSASGGRDRALGTMLTLTDGNEAETELSRLNRGYALLSRCARTLASAAGEADLLDAFCHVDRKPWSAPGQAPRRIPPRGG